MQCTSPIPVVSQCKLVFGENKRRFMSPSGSGKDFYLPFLISMLFLNMPQTCY